MKCCQGRAAICCIDTESKLARLEAERDAAIERGKLAYRYARAFCIHHATLGRTADALQERAEAAERRAGLLKSRLEGIDCILENTERLVWVADETIKQCIDGLPAKAQAKEEADG